MRAYEGSAPFQVLDINNTLIPCRDIKAFNILNQVLM